VRVRVCVCGYVCVRVCVYVCVRVCGYVCVHKCGGRSLSARVCNKSHLRFVCERVCGGEKTC